tara:strand:+ start:44973 stop:45299 length:327 start_codon:yes stop_codon:yes gene_type:complete
MMTMMMMIDDSSGPGPHSTAGARRRDAVRDARLGVGPVGVVLLVVVVVAFAFAIAFAFARVASSVAGGRRSRAERRARRRRPEMDRRYGSILARRGVGARSDGERARR